MRHSLLLTYGVLVAWYPDPTYLGTYVHTCELFPGNDEAAGLCMRGLGTRQRKPGFFNPALGTWCRYGMNRRILGGCRFGSP